MSEWTYSGAAPTGREQEGSMGEAPPGERGPGAIRPENGDGTEPGAADWLSLAAAPVFAIMALLTSVHGRGSADILCSAAQSKWPLTGMTVMYVLMSVFHSAPWLRLIASRRSS